jgi:DNA-binding SARP family transcriptional activator/LysM repeat protein
MISRARALLTGLTALAALLVAVVGLPVVLYRFGGSPLPRHLAGWHHITAVLTSKDNGTILLAVIRDLSWLAWLLFTIAVLAELQACLRGRSAPRLWLGGLQGGAARLVALAALTFAATPAISLTASAATLAPAHAGPAPRAGGQSADGLTLMSLAQPVHPGTSPNAAAARSVVVRPGDCLWSIAARYLGAGDRYPEIASMNYGHDMGDGQVFANPSLIEPGWRLQLPDSADAAGAAPVSTAPVSTAGASGTSAAHHLGHPTRDPHYRRRHAAASQPVPARLPVSGQASIPISPAGGTATAGSQATDPVGYQNAANESAAADRLPEAAVFVTGVLAGAVLTSLNRLRRKQRQYRRRGRRIPLPADPDARAAERKLRAAVSPAGPVSTLPDALHCLETGMLASGQVLPDIVGLHVTPEVLEVLLAAPALDSPPPPYAISPGRQGMCWQLELPARSGHEGSGASGGPGAPGVTGSGLLPGLFTAGGTDAGYLLLDLESLQLTGCDGPPELVDQVVTAAATELATGQWSGWYDLVLVGFDELSVLGRAEHFATVDDALQLLDERCAAVRSRLADAPPADVRQLRLTAPEDEDWGLTLLVSRIEPTADELTHLLELAEDGPGGIAALVAGDPETADGRMAPTVLQLAPDPQHPGEILANVIPLQITVRPQTLTDAEYQAISTLFEVAADLNDVSADQVPYAVYAAPPWIPEAVALAPEPGAPYPPWDEPGSAGLARARDADHAGYADHAEYEDEVSAGPAWHDSSEFSVPSWPAAPARAPAAPAQGLATPADGVATPPWVSHSAPAVQARLEVRVLGPLAITGAVEQLQPKQAELVLALALAAPAGVSNSGLCTMLGADPDHPKPSDAVRQIITRTRRRLGRAGDGREYIIHSGNGNYLLHPDVWLDWTEFRNLIAGSRAEDMRAALGLVRGEPFAGTYYWWIDIPLLETVRAEIVDAAETLGEFELATGSPRAAARAARSGQAAEVSAEQLWRLLMRAEHAAGNVAAVAEAWRHCLDAIEDIAPGGEPHPDTDALYRQLTATSRQHMQVRG